MKNNKEFEVQPLTIGRFKDLEELFGERGACGGCWCMSWRLKRSQFEEQKGVQNKEAMRAILKSGEIPGLIAYIEGCPVGWCAIAPREVYPKLERSRVLKRLDDKPVWSIVCFFVKKEFRGQGISVELIRAAVEFAKTQGATIIEGYPIEPKDQLPAPFVWTGIVSAFQKAGFIESARRSKTRPIMRYVAKKQ